MRTKTVTKHHDDAISDVVNDLRLNLRNVGFTFGALFVGQRNGDDVNYGFLFADGMPQQVIMSMLADMQKALDDAKATFQV